MSFDGIVTRAIIEELNESILNGKINKVNQPDKNCLVLNIYNKKNYKLLIDASSNNPRINLTNLNRENPIQAPNFCMFLRKHIQGGIIKSIKQLSLDRVILIEIDTLDELGYPITKTLVIELMGKYSNIILINKSDNKILDSIKRITLDMSRIRQVLPGTKYEYIKDDKINILDSDILPSTIIKNLEKPIKLFRLFYTKYTGFSPQVSREVCYLSNVDFETKSNDLNIDELERIDDNFLKISSFIKNNIYYSEIYKDLDTNKILDFHVIKLSHLGNNTKVFSSTSSMVDEFYSLTSTSDKVSQKTSVLQKTVKNSLTRNINKLEKLKKEKILSKDREKYKIWADLISANSNYIKKGQKLLIAQNFYDPELNTIEIELDETKSSWENAQYYYKKYSKLKTSSKLLDTQIPEVESEINYLLQISSTLKHVSSSNEVDEIRLELEKGHYIRKRSKSKIKNKPSVPLHYLSRNGLDIYVGKNNTQNDYLTLKFSNRDDYFIHAKDVPGSHVILRNNNISEEDIFDACCLAAYYSSEAEQEYVLVDYTERKNVKKSKGSKPGMVYYDNYETKMINLKEFNIENLKKL
ncbi:Rqc2 family fibronectin-binding protein [Miniphocaeibacter massiliensis]|uniref:Rqc2 family fibronectin-binding protein n=1 Tax=Miniphocaeibacter massiliensis TaxID=2041841 RepID=UPI000C06A42C|nr:NFACT RNA binding domain-containing protein [Miniphocaeibacter massiliensis]